jgi:hypothetical protein
MMPSRSSASMSSGAGAIQWPVVAAAALTITGCFYGDENDWASRSDVIEAAERCGVPDFEPTEAGAAYAAYVPAAVPNAAAKEDCIYKDLEGQGLLATR